MVRRVEVRHSSYSTKPARFNTLAIGVNNIPRLYSTMAEWTGTGAADSSSIRVPYLDLQKNSPSSSTKKHVKDSDILIFRSEFEELYGPYQALHIRGYVPDSACTSDKFHASDIQSLFETLNSQDKESWCIENELSNNSNNSQTADGAKDTQLSPVEFLSVSNTRQRGYCSFLVQHSKKEMNKLFLNRLPMVHLPVIESTADGSTNTMKVNYGPCLWFFFGKNYNDCASSPTTLKGRVEHTDSVTHDGTWHYQLSGTKIWRLRPTVELVQRIDMHTKQQQKKKCTAGIKRKMDDDTDSEVLLHNNNEEATNSDKKYIEVECKEGDIIFLNTRLWWHSTLIPPQDTPCISYARDIYFQSSDTSDSCDLDKKSDYIDVQEDTNSKQQSSMANVDGTYAAEDIEADTILFTEQTMPDCELHRSKTNPNCRVVELDDDKTGESYMAVVSLRNITAGEFFSLLESDDEDDSGDDNELEESDEEDL